VIAEKGKKRLQVYLSHAGVASRRKCEELILQGRVRVNGSLVKKLGTQVEPEDSVRLDNREVFPEKKNFYIVLHKPKAYITSRSDPEGRPVIFSLLGDAIGARLFSVGRLDFRSSGLVLLTNDGEFARFVSHPSSQIEKEYSVDTKKEIPQDLLYQVLRGIEKDGVRYRIKRFKHFGPRRANLVLTEGKNREIRNIFAYWNIPLKRVHRIRIGRIFLKNLPSGHFRHLSATEIRSVFPHENKKTKGVKLSDNSD
jgi:23S rRNA pseudouridine2605 synthase